MLKNKTLILLTLSLLIGCSQNKNQNDSNKLNPKLKNNERMDDKKDYYVDSIIKAYDKNINEAILLLKGKWELIEKKSKKDNTEFSNSKVTIEFINSSKVILNEELHCTFEFFYGSFILNDCSYDKSWWNKQLTLSSVTDECLRFAEQEFNASGERSNAFLLFKRVKSKE